MFNYNKTLKLIKFYRITIFIYNQFNRILINTKQEFDKLLHINKKKYYNFIFFTIRNQRDILISFLIVVEVYFNIIIRTRFEYKRNVNKISIKRILKQIL